MPAYRPLKPTDYLTPLLDLRASAHEHMLNGLVLENLFGLGEICCRQQFQNRRRRAHLSEIRNESPYRYGVFPRGAPRMQVRSIFLSYFILSNHAREMSDANRSHRTTEHNEAGATQAKLPRAHSLCLFA